MIRRRYAASRAEGVLETFGAKPPRVEPRRLAELLGAKVVGIEDEDGSGSGLVARQGDTIVIGVNESHAEVRQRFTIAHEIGHMLLHAEQPLIVDHGFALIGERRDGVNTCREIEANAFAAALLMPEQWVRDAVRGRHVDLSDDAEIVALAKQFGVSQQAMMYRLINLGLLRNL